MRGHLVHDEWVWRSAGARRQVQVRAPARLSAPAAMWIEVTLTKFRHAECCSHMAFDFPSGTGQIMIDRLVRNQARLVEYEDQVRPLLPFPSPKRSPAFGLHLSCCARTDPATHQERVHAQEEELANVALKRWRFNLLTKALDSWAEHTFCVPHVPHFPVAPEAPSHSMAEWLGATGHSTDVDSDAYVGLSVTTRPPHAVVSVIDLYDKNFVKQGEPGYINPTIMPGDSILEVDGTPAEHVPVDKLHHLLSGKIHTCVKIVLARELTFDQYQVNVIRHKKHEFGDPLASADHRRHKHADSTTHRMEHGSATRMQRSAAPPHNLTPQLQGALNDSRSDRWSPVYENMATPQCAEENHVVMHGHHDMVNACDWSEADGGMRWLLSASTDQTLRFWDVARNVCQEVVQGHDGSVWCCSLASKDGGRRWALSGSRDKTLRVFDLQLNQCALVLEGHKASVYACKFSVGASDASMILSGSADKTLRVWDGQSGACHQILEGHSQAVSSHHAVAHSVRSSRLVLTNR